jgi:hypothetical protein
MLSLLLALTMIVGCAGLWSVRVLSGELRSLYNENVRTMAHLSNAERGLWELRFAMPSYVLAGPEARKSIEAQADETIQSVSDAIDAFKSLPISQEERELLGQWQDQFSLYHRVRPHYFALVNAGKLDEAVDYSVRETNPPARESVRVLGALIELQRSLGDAKARAAEAQATLATRLMIGILVVALGLGAFFGRSLARHIAERITEALQIVQQSSRELEGTAGQQLSRARNLATVTAEISVTIRELVAMSRQISESARSVTAIAEMTGESARSGDSQVKHAQESLSNMRRKVDETVKHMLNLGRKSQEIGGILALINDLAEQTNILSINARIEAAGDSEASRRFSVVADEIRRLADRVGGSAREIRDLVNDIQAATNTTVTSTEDGVKAVDLGVRQFDDVLKALQAIADRVSETTVAARRIELSTAQQVSAVEQVNVAIGDVVRSAAETESSSLHTLQTCEQLLVGVSAKLASLSAAATSRQSSLP